MLPTINSGQSDVRPTEVVVNAGEDDEGDEEEVRKPLNDFLFLLLFRQWACLQATLNEARILPEKI